jgi:hypothetical protein
LTSLLCAPLNMGRNAIRSSICTVLPLLSRRRKASPAARLFYLYPISIEYHIQGITTPKFFEVIRE